MSNKAVIYARFSSHSQNEQTIDTQVDICTSYAKKNNLNIVHVYKDKGKTGTNDNREEFQQMLADSSKKGFSHVIVYNLSRFARNSTESVMNEMILSKNGVDVLSATENVNGDDDDPIASLMKNIMRGVNEYYSKNTAKNIRDGLRTNAKKGLSIGGFSLPLGYKSNSKKEIIIDEVQNLVEQKHISHSRKSDYLLTDKLYCGLCGAKMTGAVAKHKYHYYKCINSKGSLKTCHKEKVDREFIEELVVKETRKMLTKENIRIIANKVIEFLEQEKDLSEIKKLQHALKKCEKEIESLLIAVRQATSDSVRNLLISELEKTQEQQKGLKAQLSYEEANNMPVTASEVRFYLTELKKGNINTKKYKRILIDTFIYKIYLYDEKIVINYTTQDSNDIKLPDRNLVLSSLEGTIAPPNFKL